MRVSAHHLRLVGLRLARIFAGHPALQFLVAQGAAQALRMYAHKAEVGVVTDASATGAENVNGGIFADITDTRAAVMQVWRTRACSVQEYTVTASMCFCEKRRRLCVCARAWVCASRSVCDGSHAMVHTSRTSA